MNVDSTCPEYLPCEHKKRTTAYECCGKVAPGPFYRSLSNKIACRTMLIVKTPVDQTGMDGFKLFGLNISTV